MSFSKFVHRNRTPSVHMNKAGGLLNKTTLCDKGSFTCCQLDLLGPNEAVSMRSKMIFARESENEIWVQD